MGERLQAHIDNVTVEGLALALVFGAVAFFLIPPRHRLRVCLSWMVLQLTLARLPELGAPSSLAKLLSGASYLSVALAALLHPGPRYRIPSVAWLFFGLGAFAVVSVLSTQGIGVQAALRLQWCVLVLGATLVVTTFVDEESVRRVLHGLYVGMALSTLLTFSVIVDPHRLALTERTGRFSPYGCNPNQIATVLALTIPLGAYFAFRTRDRRMKSLHLAVVGLATGLLVMTASRAGLLIALVASLSLLIDAPRRPRRFSLASLAFALAPLGFGLGMAGALWGVAVTPPAETIASIDGEAASVEMSGASGQGASGGALAAKARKRPRRTPHFYSRLGRGLTKRFGHAGNAMEDLAGAPALDLLFGHGVSAETRGTEEPAVNPHNAFIKTLTAGGLVIAVPSLLLLLYAQYCSVRVWLLRRDKALDDRLLSLLAALSLAFFAHGLTNNIMLHPTYAWPLIGAMVGVFFVSSWVAPEARPGAPRSRRPPLPARVDEA